MTTEAVGDVALDRLARRLGAMARRDAPLGALTTYRVGGTAALTVEASCEADLVEVGEAMEAARAAGEVPVLVLGKGSNVLVADGGFRGLVVRLAGSLTEIRVLEGDPADERVVVRAGGGAGLPVLARRSVEAGLTGLEWAVGIPGTVGGALKMNAGGHGSDTAACLVAFRWVDIGGAGAPAGRELADREPADGEPAGREPAGQWARAGEAGPERLRLGYRSSALGDAEVVVWADLATRRGDRDRGRETISEIVRWRRENQPGGSNAGSVFKNPPGDSAGRLVDEAGLKGFRHRTARVSEKHANFIQADDTGSAADVVELMRLVRERVAAATGIVLGPEVKLVGFGDEPLAEPDGRRAGAAGYGQGAHGT